jgi:hypothetical protein
MSYFIAFLESNFMSVWMQALDNFISPIAGFEGDISIPTIPVSARPPDDESISDPSVGAGASALKTWAGKWKATANSTPLKKPRKPWGNPLTGSKLMNPRPRLLLWLLHRVLVGRSWSSAKKGMLVTSVFPSWWFLTREPLYRVPQDINQDSTAKSTPASDKSPKVDKPLGPQAGKIMSDSLMPSSPKW